MIGTENDMRAVYFGLEASTAPVTAALERDLDRVCSAPLDVRDDEGIQGLFGRYRHAITLIIHAATHHWRDSAALDPRPTSPSMPTGR